MKRRIKLAALFLFFLGCTSTADTNTYREFVGEGLGKYTAVFYKALREERLLVVENISDVPMYQIVFLVEQAEGSVQSFLNVLLPGKRHTIKLSSITANRVLFKCFFKTELRAADVFEDNIEVYLRG